MKPLLSLFVHLVPHMNLPRFEHETQRCGAGMVSAPSSYATCRDSTLRRSESADEVGGYEKSDFDRHFLLVMPLGHKQTSLSLTPLITPH
jgi:hypothetical protein